MTRAPVGPRLFLLVMCAAVFVLLAGFATSTVHSYDLLERRDATARRLSAQIDHLTAQTRALEDQLRANHLEPVVTNNPASTRGTPSTTTSSTPTTASITTSTTSTTTSTTTPRHRPCTLICVPRVI